MQAKTKSAIKLGVVLALVVLIAVCGLTGSLRIGKYRFYPFSDFLSPGLDLGGGVSANLSAQDASAENLDALLDQTVAVLRARLSGLELDEAGAVRQGDGVRVDLPDSNDAQELLDAICAPGHVEFADTSGNVLLEGDAIASARAVTVTNSLGETYPAVEFHLSDEAIERYAEDAEALTGQTLSVYVDDALVSSTAVDEAITGGAGYIPFYNYSTYSQAVEASRLYAAIFASGELPLALTDAGSGEVSPQAGNGAARLAAIALCAALAVTAVALIVRYRLAGLAGALALAIWALVVTFLLCELPDVTLTLSSLAGLLPGLGCVAGGSALLIRRCLRFGGEGRAPRAALRAAFRSSMPALLDAGAAALVAAALLYWIGSGPVRAFAVSLLISCLSALAVLALLFRFLLGNVLNLTATPFAFVPTQKKPVRFSARACVAAAAVVVVAGLALQLCGAGLTAGYDFGGGAALRFAVGESYELSDVEAALADAGISDYQLVRLEATPAETAGEESAAEPAQTDAADASEATEPTASSAPEAETTDAGAAAPSSDASGSADAADTSETAEPAASSAPDSEMTDATDTGATEPSSDASGSADAADASEAAEPAASSAPEAETTDATDAGATEPSSDASDSADAADADDATDTANAAADAENSDGATESAAEADGLTDVEIRVPAAGVATLEAAQSSLEAALAAHYPNARLVSFQTFSSSVDGGAITLALWALLAACACAAIYAGVRFGVCGGVTMLVSGLLGALIAAALTCLLGWAFRAEASLLAAAAFAAVCSLGGAALALNRLRETLRAPGASRLSRADIAETSAADIQGRTLAACLPMLLGGALLLALGPFGVRAQGFALLAGSLAGIFTATQVTGRLWACLSARFQKKSGK